MSDQWSTACPDWAGRLRRGESIIPAPIFPAEAERALDVFKRLRIVDAPGSPTFGEACAKWVFDFVAVIFGSCDPETGRRLIREALLLIPKKNSKSTIAAGIMLTALILNWRQSAEMIVLAPTVEIANNAFAPARDMIKVDDELSDLMMVQAHYRTITNQQTGATLKVVAADSDTVGGKKASWVLIDEEWLFGKKANAENMFREAAGGLASRPEGIVIKLSTQSDEPPAGVFKQDLQRARDVRDGVKVDPAFLPVIYEYPPDMIEDRSYRDPKNFWMVNPNLGHSVDLEFLEREFSKAESAGEESMRGLLAKHFNVEIGLNLRSDRWLGADFWECCAVKQLDLDILIQRSEVLTVGVDGGGLDDLLGLAVCGRCKTTGNWLIWTHAWAHPSVLERRKSEAPRLRDFAAAGHLTLVKRIGEDVTQVAEIGQRVEETGLLDQIGLDPAGIGGIQTALESEGVPSEKLVSVSQGWRLNGAIKTTERKLAEGTLEHEGQPMMAWCVGNAKIEPKGNAITITKQASGTAKIDPLMAVFNAVHLMSLNPESKVVDLDSFLSNPVIA